MCVGKHAQFRARQTRCSAQHPNLRCSAETMPGTAHTVQCAARTMQCRAFTIQCTEHTTMRCTADTMRCTADTMRCTTNALAVAVLATYDAAYGISERERGHEHAIPLYSSYAQGRRSLCRRHDALGGTAACAMQRTDRMMQCTDRMMQCTAHTMWCTAHTMQYTVHTLIHSRHAYVCVRSNTYVFFPSNTHTHNTHETRTVRCS